MKNVARLKARQGGFVLLRHELPASRKKDSHWDLMLQTHNLLLTLRLASLPDSDCSSTTLKIERLDDHRNIYLDYQGPISGDRGSVTQVARGEYQINSRHGSYVTLELESRTLQARIEFEMCDVGQSAAMTIHHWALST